MPAPWPVHSACWIYVTLAQAGREVIHFVDNTTALSKAVHGYANEPDMANLVNSLHICDAMLAIDAWWEWVPSKANVADLPTAVIRPLGTRLLAT